MCGIITREVIIVSAIARIDKNFKVETKINKDDIKFYDIKSEPFKIYGVFYQNGKFRRMPEAVAEKVSDGVRRLHANTAGGRVRFKTDSKYVAINAKMSDLGKMPHFALTGSIGFDLYVRVDDNDRYMGTYLPPFDVTDSYESIIEFDEAEMREITINFPLYSEVCELYIGLSENAQVLEHDDYKYEKPIVYYGSSITQGGCASRPGNSYQAIISRRFDTDYINLGFSGNAKAEDEIAEYIKLLDMSIFVYDYDHNSPNCEHYENTHKKMFKTIRKAHPDIPIIMMSRPKHYLNMGEKKRVEIMTKTFENAKANGDNNVYMLTGKDLTTLCGNEGTVDNVHPNDFGFASMAQALGDLLEKEIF